METLIQTSVVLCIEDCSSWEPLVFDVISGKERWDALGTEGLEDMERIEE